MNKKKAFAWMGSLLILGLGIAFSAENPQKAARNSFQNTIKSDFKPGPFFVDENGDGICDRAYDRKNAGNSNRQDPNWAQHKEESNFQNKNENKASSDHFQNRFSHREQNTWKRQNRRENRANFGNCVCDGTGPNSKRSRKGNGRG